MLFRSLDPEEVKFALFTNINALVKLQIDREAKDISRKLVILEGQIDTLKRFDFKLRKFYEYREKCMERISDLIIKYKGFFLTEPLQYDQASWWTAKNKREQEGFLTTLKETIDAAEAFRSSANQEDKEMLRLGRQLYHVIKDTNMKDSREEVFSEFKAYLSEVRKAEKTILEKKGYTINDNFETIIEAYQKEHYQVLQEKERIQGDDYASEVYEQVVKKKEKLAIQGKTIEERVEDFAKLNYLLDYKASEVSGDNCMIPEQGMIQRPPIKNLDKDTDSGKKLRLAKAKAQAIRLKLELLNLDGYDN